MPRKSPAFRFYVDNFVEGTIEMTDSEAGLYVRLLCAQWSKGGLPNDDSELLRFSRGSTTAQQDLNRVKRKFDVCADGMLRNERLEIERSKQEKFSKSQSDKGKASAALRAMSTPHVNPGSAGVQPRTGVQPSVSVSVSPVLERERDFPECVDRPTEAEVLAYAHNGGVFEWKAKDWFQEMQGCGWLDYQKRPIRHWQSVFDRMKTKWEADGRPKSPPVSKNGTTAHKPNKIANL